MFILIVLFVVMVVIDAGEKDGYTLILYRVAQK